MLTTLSVEQIKFAASMDRLTKILGDMQPGGSEVVMVKQGYYIAGLNTHKALDPIKADQYLSPGVEGIGGYPTSYFVVDSPEQFIERYDAAMEKDSRILGAFFTRFSRETEPDEGGWRWHKWGEYIGDFKPQMEYLHDEPEIETIYTVTIESFHY